MACGESFSAEKGNPDLGDAEAWYSSGVERRIYGCVFLHLPGRSVCQRSDGKYASAWSESFFRTMERGGRVCAAGHCICAGNRHRGIDPVWHEG